MTTQPLKPSVSRLYRTGTWVFLAVSVVVAGSIAALALSKTEIIITLGTKQVNADTTVNVSTKSASGSDDLVGTILTATADDTTTVTVQSDGPTVDDYAKGTVTIKSAWTKTQPLAIGTRLKASSNNIIYKTDKFVDVPAHGQVTVNVTASEKGATGNVEPDHFTIVALWPGLQSQIFGESTATFTGGTRSAGAVSQAAIDEASQTLLKKLTSAAAVKLPSPPSGTAYIGDVVVTTSSTTPSVKAGAEVASFTIHGNVSVAGVAANQLLLASRATEALANRIGQDEEKIDQPMLTTTITNANVKNGTAIINLTVTANVRLKTSSSIFRPELFTQKTSADILATLRGTSGITDAHVTISPFWSSITSAMASSIHISFGPSQ